MSINTDYILKNLTINVPKDIEEARVELLTFRGAPIFVGTTVAKLHFDKTSLILSSKMSGVVDCILVNNNETVFAGQRLFEFRFINVNRRKSGSSNRPTFLQPPKPCIKKKEELETQENSFVFRLS